MIAYQAICRYATSSPSKKLKLWCAKITMPVDRVNGSIGMNSWPGYSNDAFLLVTLVSDHF